MAVRFLTKQAQKILTPSVSKLHKKTSIFNGAKLVKRVRPNSGNAYITTTKYNNNNTVSVEKWYPRVNQYTRRKFKSIEQYNEVIDRQDIKRIAKRRKQDINRTAKQRKLQYIQLGTAAAAAAAGLYGIHYEYKKLTSKDKKKRKKR